MPPPERRRCGACAGRGAVGGAPCDPCDGRGWHEAPADVDDFDPDSPEPDPDP